MTRDQDAELYALADNYRLARDDDSRERYDNLRKYVDGLLAAHPLQAAADELIDAREGTMKTLMQRAAEYAFANCYEARLDKFTRDAWIAGYVAAIADAASVAGEVEMDEDRPGRNPAKAIMALIEGKP